MERPDRITLRAFQAPREPELCREFLREHRKVLEDYGISNVTTNNDEWTRDPGTYVIVALHETLGMVGGIRLEMARPGRGLPMELALRKLDPSIHDHLKVLEPYGNGEVCGLWNANRYAMHGVPVLLSQAVTALSVMVGAQRMVCLVATYTQRHPSRNGFVVLDAVGEKGTFIYPIPSITAVAMVNPDTLMLEHASQDQRHLVYSLRLRPDQTRLERPGKHNLEVTYRMKFHGSLIDLEDYRPVEEQYQLFSA
ncbi:MAG: hypothetical protein JNM31_01365 [Flavobacteriales bacterium]|nr:hypothetical protein [Flavobacteriales bacterium]